jgi:hypothetical protein
LVLGGSRLTLGGAGLAAVAAALNIHQNRSDLPGKPAPSVREPRRRLAARRKSGTGPALKYSRAALTQSKMKLKNDRGHNLRVGDVARAIGYLIRRERKMGPARHRAVFIEASPSRQVGRALGLPSAPHSGTTAEYPQRADPDGNSGRREHRGFSYKMDLLHRCPHPRRIHHLDASTRRQGGGQLGGLAVPSLVACPLS